MDELLHDCGNGLGKREGGWILTYTGRRFWLLNPRPEDIDPHDIAHGLALTCRFNGQCRHFYSVAQHCVLAAKRMEQIGGTEPEIMLALLHDAAEAYVGDLVRPLKMLIPEYVTIEEKVELAILEAFDVRKTSESDSKIKVIDLEMLQTERRDLMAQASFKWSEVTTELEDTQPLAEKIVPWPMDFAEESWLQLFQLFHRHQGSDLSRPAVRAYIETLDDEQRLEFVGQLMEGYCPGCGREERDDLEPGGCSCQKDE